MLNKQRRLTEKEIIMLDLSRAIGTDLAIERIQSANEDKQAYEFEQNEKGARMSFKTEERITTLDGLVKSCQIDLNEWVIKSWSCKKWEMAAVPRVTGSTKDGWKRENNTPVVTPLFAVSVELLPNKVGQAVQDLREGLLEDIRNYVAPVTWKDYSHIQSQPEVFNTMAQFNIFDAHIDKLCWHEETGENYDLKIAVDRFRYCVRELARKAMIFNVERILLPVGNDFFNTDNSENTTKRGTRQDVDVRGKKSFRRGVNLIRETIDFLSQIAEVNVVVIPGNHDEEKAWYLGEVLEAIYSENGNVHIDNSPKKRKYYQYGANLIGLTHGDKEKPADLPGLMATEVPALWGATKYREFHLGHFHHEKVKDMLGCTIRYMRSISGTDVWHFDSGYLGAVKSAECFIWKRDGGLEGSFYANVSVEK